MRKGFTLIELLAVIVILAIIALIATPIVLSIINDSKESAYLRSTEMYIAAIEQAVAREKMNKANFKPKDCIILEGNLKCTGYEILEVEVNGEKPISGSITFKEGKIKYVNLKYKNNKKIIKTDEGKLMHVDYLDGEVVYFDVSSGIGCKEEDYDVTNSNTGYNGFNNKASSTDITLTDKLETQNSCLKFYAYNDDGGDIINLLLDHNTTAKVVWNSSGSNASGPKEIMTQLNLDTISWKGTNTPANYTVTQSSTKNYTIDYSTYKARLITANEIAQITKNKSFDETKSIWNQYYYFDSKISTKSATCKSGDTSGCMYGWLYDRTDTSCKDYGCLNNSDSFTGYWTSTSTAGATYNAWRVFYGSNTDCVSVNINGGGVRPVIEVSKNKLIN